MSVLYRYSLRHLLAALLISGLALCLRPVLPDVAGCAAYAQVTAPGSPTGVFIRPRPRGYSDRWPLMFTWTRNKVNWWNLSWRSVKLPSSTLYYYQKAEPVARLVRTLVTESDSRIQASFDYDLQEFTEDKTIPKIIYTSHHTFQQTNTIAAQIPEGVAGFTEFTKGRVVFPYTGSNSDFLHVLEHENTHIHMIHKLRHVFKAHGINDLSKLIPTLWFAEGLAEFESQGRDPVTGQYRMDPETEMYMRDGIINDRLPTIRAMRLYPNWERVYKFGHALLQYLGARYGADRIHELLSQWHHIFPNRASFTLLRRRALDTYDPLNPGVDHLQPPFVRAGDKDIPVVKTPTGWRAETTAGLVDTLDGTAVEDLVSMSENIQLDGQWFRIISDPDGAPAFYRPDRGMLFNWEGKSAKLIIRRQKQAYEEEAYKLMSFERLLEWWLQTDLDELSEQWHEDLKNYYRPWLEGRTLVTDLRMVGKASLGLWPNVSPDGRLVYYKAYQDDYTFTVLVLDLESGHQVELARENTPATESIHILTEGGDIWPMGEGRYRTLYTAQHRDRDLVYIQDLVRHQDGQLERVGSRKVGFDAAVSDLIAISGVRFAGSPDRILFSGLSLDGFQDLYLADLAGGSVERRLTNDLASDRMPVLWENRIVFSSDRASPPSTFAYHLFSYDLESGAITQLTDGPGNELNANLSPSGNRLFFQSDATGVSNIYQWVESGIPRQVTDVATGVFTPAAVGPDTLLVSGFNEGKYRLHLLPVSDVQRGTGDGLADIDQHIGAPPPSPDSLRCTRLPWGEDRVPTADLLASEPMESHHYRPAFSLDDFYASSEFGGIRSYNTSVFGSEIRFSDILGNHLVGAAVWNGPRRGLKDLSWVITYWNQKNRLKLGTSVFRTSGVYFNLMRQDFYIRERAGINAQFNLPFSQFSDLDIFVSAAIERRHRGTITEGSVKFKQVELGIGYTRDVSTWGPQGPHRGWVFSALYDHIFNASDRFSVFNRYLIADVRGYLPLHRYIVAAGRLAWGHASGEEPEFFFLGGGFFLRGYWNLYSLYGSAYELANAELRLQLLEIMGLEPIKMFEQSGWPLQLALFAEGARTRWKNHRLGPLGSAGISLRLTLALPFVIEYAWYKKNFWDKDGERDRGVLITLLF